MSDAGHPADSVSPQRGEARLLVGCVLAALAVRVVVVARTPVINSDGPLYIAQARAFMEGDLRTAVINVNYAPAYAGLIALAARAGVPIEAAGYLVSVLAAAFAAIPLYALTKRAFGPATAAGSAWVYAFLPVAAHLSGSILTTGLFLLVGLLTAALSAQLLDRPRLGTAFLAGCMVALSYATRADGLLLAPFALGAAMAARSASLPRRALLAIAVSLPSALVAAACVAWTWNGLGFPLSRKLGGEAWERFIQIAWPTSYAWKCVLEDVTEAMFVPFVLVAALGCVRRRPSEGSGVRLAMLLLVGAWLACLLQYATATGAMSKRYVTPVVVLLLPWTVEGLRTIGERLGRLAGGSESALRWCRTGTLVAACVACLPKIARTHEGARLAEKAAGLYLRDIASSDRRILCGGTCVPHYAGHPSASTKWALLPPDRAFSELRHRCVAYVACDPGLESLAPRFVQALQEPRATLVAEITVPESPGRVPIYRLNDPGRKEARR